MRKVTITFQGMAFTFAVHSRGKQITSRGHCKAEWVKIKVVRHGQTVDYCYAKDGTSMRDVANRWLGGSVA